MKAKSFLIVTFFLVLSQARAVLLPSVYSNHMVLMQNSDVKIWGWGKPMENVIITTSWDNSEYKAVVNNYSDWSTLLKTPAAGGPFSITVKGYNTIEINDVLIGEVWVCSGQSNMEWTARAGITDAEKHIREANYPKIRFFSVSHRTSDFPQLDVVGEWKVCTPETMIDFSAIGYFFAKNLNDSLKVPVGMINSSWGGTPAEIWFNANDLKADPFLTEGAALQKEVPWGPVKPGVAYNSMVFPLTQFPVSGAIWYQGEGNAGLAKYYTGMLSALIQSWRNAWNKDFPFYFVQIAPYKYGSLPVCAELQNAQRLVKLAGTGMVVINDIGDTTDIHPRNKAEVGKRLANMALAKNYGKTGIVCQGPVYKEIKVEKNTLRVYFDNAEGGLKTNDKALRWFEIAGSDKVFYPATAKIEKNTVILNSKKVKMPLYVRFAWSNTAVPSLYNSAGLPASCFISENYTQP
ncbi:MAG: sialate O-acetylesterase [Bacteroidales bacterium]